MKTIKEWLEELPEPYRSQALDNASSDKIPIKQACLSQAIHDAFGWYDSPQGELYWRELHKFLVEKDKIAAKEALESIMDIGIGSRATNAQLEILASKKAFETRELTQLSNRELAEKIWNEIMVPGNDADGSMLTIESILDQHR